MKISVFYEHIAEASLQSGKSVAEICRVISALGVTGVEIENKRLVNESEREQVLKDLKQAALEISCMYGFFDFSHGEDIRNGFRFIDIASDLNIKKVMLIPGFFEKKENTFWKRKRIINRMVSALKAVCEYAKDKNIMVVLEDFDNSIAYYSNAGGLKYFLDEIPELFCAFDTGNFLYSEEDSFEVLPMFLNRVGHVHCKDRTFVKKEGEVPQKTIRGREMYSCAVGKGCIRMKEIVDTLLQHGYDDYFAAEHFGSMNQLEDIKSSVSWLSQF